MQRTLFVILFLSTLLLVASEPKPKPKPKPQFPGFGYGGLFGRPWPMPGRGRRPPFDSFGFEQIMEPVSFGWEQLMEPVDFGMKE